MVTVMPGPVTVVTDTLLMIALREQTNSGQSGWAVLTANGDETEVALTLSAGTMETELVHIHSGSCGDDTLGGIVHDLSSFVGGSGASVTTLAATLASLSTGSFAINTHKAGDPGVYTSCGNIPATADALSVALNGQDDSGQSGWATLTSRGEQTEVVLNLAGGALQTELVHIHSGQCGRDTLGGVVHDLTSFVGGNGGSVTSIDVTLASLRTGDFAINSHKLGEPGVYTSCGNIPEGQPDVLAIALGEDHDSGQSGQATLTAVGFKTVVALDLSVGAMETEFVHIHSGSCGYDTLGGIVHGLSSFVGGSGASVTTLGATLASLRTGEFAINTHKAGDPGVYTSCGNIPPAADTLSVSIALNGQDDSGQSGWATLTSRGEQTEVVLNLAGGALQTELVHIHSGQCGRDTLGGVEHDLTSFVGGNGGSVTTIDATLASLRTGDFAVNSHQAGNPGMYTACGNIPIAGPRVSASVTIGPSKDNTLYEDPDKAVSNGAGQYFFAGQTSLGQTRRGLISFDIAGSIPAGATIDSVRLSLNMSRTSSGEEPVELRRVLADWSEGATDADEEEGKGAAAAVGDATWEHRTFDTVTWESPGGDFSSAASASTQVAAKERYTWGSTAEMVVDVQGWLDSRSTNFGWILLGREEGGKSSKRFDTKENETRADRPVLTIEYTS